MLYSTKVPNLVNLYNSRNASFTWGLSLHLFLPHRDVERPLVNRWGRAFRIFWERKVQQNCFNSHTRSCIENEQISCTVLQFHLARCVLEPSGERGLVFLKNVGEGTMNLTSGCCSLSRVTFYCSRKEPFSASTVQKSRKSNSSLFRIR